jgi:hypothetical protein
MYKQYGIDRGRKDHWALYPAPPKINVVRENGPIALNLTDELRRTLQIQTTEQEILEKNITDAVEQKRSESEVRKLRRNLAERAESVQELHEQLAFMETKPEPTRWEKALEGVVVRSHDAKAALRMQVEFASLVEVFNRIYGERRFTEAHMIAKQARKLQPESPVAITMFYKSKIAQRNASNERLRGIEDAELWNMLDDVELSFTQMDPTIRFPDNWEELATRRRIRKWNIQARDRDFSRELAPFARIDRVQLGSGSLLDQVEVRRDIKGQKLDTQVAREIQDARVIAVDDPETALTRLKSAMGAVRAASDIESDLQIELARRLTSVIADVKGNVEVRGFRAIRAQERIATQRAEARLIESIEQRWDDAKAQDLLRPTNELQELQQTKKRGFSRVQHDTRGLQAAVRQNAAFQSAFDGLGLESSNGVIDVNQLGWVDIPGDANGRYRDFVLTMPLPYSVTGRWRTRFSSHAVVRQLLERQSAGIPLANQLRYDVELGINLDVYFLQTFGRPARLRLHDSTVLRRYEGRGIDMSKRHSGLERGVSYQYLDNGIVIVRDGLLRDLADYCPGLETTQADLQAILAAAVDPKDKPIQGKVDPGARRLIENARATGWESLEIKNEQLRTSFQIVYNGAAQFRVERKTADGLREKIICDGKTLWHIYPELGIGTKRPFTRFHELGIQNLIPWHVPTVDELSQGADIKLVGKNVIRVCPLKPQNKSKKANKAGETKEQKQPEDSNDVLDIVFEFVFNKSGRLSERRVLNSKTSRVLARLQISDDGRVRFETLINGKMKSHERKLARQLNAKEPRLTLKASDKKELVVLPLPFRSASYVSEQIAKQRAAKTKSKSTETASGARDPAEDKPNEPVDKTKEPQILSADQALQLVTAFFAEGKTDLMNAAIKQHFFDKNDHRIGFAVLMASANYFSDPVINATKKHEDSPLASFIKQYAIWRQNGNHNEEFVVPKGSCEFLRNVANSHNIWLNWMTGRATQNKTAQQIGTDLNDALEFIDSSKNPDVAWELIETIFRALEKSDTATAGQFGQLVKSTDRFRVHGSDLSMTPLLLKIRLKARQEEIALKELREYINDQVETLGLIAHDSVLRKAFADALTRGDGKKGEPASNSRMKPWNSILTDAAKKLIERKRRSSVISLADACWSDGDRELAETLFDLAVDGVSFATQPRLGMRAIDYLSHTKDWQRSEKYLQMFPADSVVRKTARYWRSASNVAQQLKRDNESILRLEKALDIEFAGLPQNIPLKPLRDQYSSLMARYTKLLKKADLKDAALVRDLTIRIIKATDRWRAIDPDTTALCYRAALLLHTLGQVELAWSYWTTPLASKPRDSSLWRKLAVEMNNKGLVDRSHEAYTQAFACEPTNPDILWHHAATLKARGRRAEGNALVKKIVEGKWQPRFSGVVNQAKRAIAD